MNKRNTTYSEHPTRASKQAHQMAKKKFPTYDTSLINPKPSKRPYVIAAVFAALIVIGAAIILVISLSGCTPRLAKGETVDVVIEKGATTSDIANTLEKQNVIGSQAFINAVNDMDASSKLQSGTYTIEGGQTDKEYVQIFIDGPYAYSKKITVTEGMTLKNIASQIETVSEGNILATNFINQASDASKYAAEFSFLTTAGNNSLEGFLFPKTYAYDSECTADSLIKDMLNQFKESVANLDFSYPTNNGMTLYDAIKLASIVEKESANGYQSRVASVFYNRLNSSMRLQSDATTAYEVGHDPTADEVHANTPYSTYTNDGLPPTPICNPGLEAIQAVCNPENTNYLYFYFKNVDGQLKYQFSETYEQHQSAIANM